MVTLEQKVAKMLFEWQSTMRFGFDKTDWDFLWTDLNRRQQEPYYYNAKKIIDVINNENTTGECNGKGRNFREKRWIQRQEL